MKFIFSCAAASSFICADTHLLIRHPLLQPYPFVGVVGLLVAAGDALAIVGIGVPLMHLAAARIEPHFQRREALQLRLASGRVRRMYMEAGGGEHRLERLTCCAGVSIAEDLYSQKLVTQTSYVISSATLKFPNDCDEMIETARAGTPITFSAPRRTTLQHHALSRTRRQCRRSPVQAWRPHHLLRPSASARFQDTSTVHAARRRRGIQKTSARGGPYIEPLNIPKGLAGQFIKDGTIIAIQLGNEALGTNR
jgi:hypothetical protein